MTEFKVDGVGLRFIAFLKLIRKNIGEYGEASARVSRSYKENSTKRTNKNLKGKAK